ncbi:hypothetical protein CLV99_0895 [Sphingobacterium yanglingense]|uniref:Uncharacterized protein n=1 Tax=Sphingobacterium yanglingense TaxID=1437280 RepID=A0A4R6WKK1_9SPHI|nr:hypothetical protein CLV99_0895 [Sphingobacterium yanglingense]
MNKMVNEIYYSGGTFLSTNKSTQPKKGRIDIEPPFEIRATDLSFLSTEEPSPESKRYLLKTLKLLLFILSSISVVLQAPERGITRYL